MTRSLVRLAAVAALMSLPGAAVDAGADERVRVLYLGDSLSIGAFGRTLDRSMRSAGFEVHTVVAGGASPYYWLDRYQPMPCTIGFWEKSPSRERRVGYVRAVPKIEDLIEQHEPNVVVVQTGINLYATLRSKRRSKEENVAEVRSLIDQMCYAVADAGALSYWVLPPDSHEERYPESLQEELESIMAEVVNEYEGEVFESQEVTEFVDPYPATDGIHYGPEEARGWAEKVSRHFNKFMDVRPAPERRTIVRAVPLDPPDPPEGERPGSGRGRAGAESQREEVDLVLKLVAKSEIEHLAELDYANALGVYEYEVLEDRLDNYPHDRVRVAHGIVFGRKYTGAAKREIGARIDLTLVPLSKYRTLSTWQMDDDLRPNFELPLYTPKLD